jgi:hypothetical protein
VLVFPQSSVAVYVRVCELKQPLVVMVPSKEVMVTIPQSSVAVAIPGGGTPVGLQPKLAPSGQKVNVGPVKSSSQVKIWEQVLMLPQASIAV